jgi:hypothetical protein
MATIPFFPKKSASNIQKMVVQKALGNHLRSVLRKAGEGVDSEDSSKLVEWDAIDVKIRTNAAQSFSLQYGQEQAKVAQAMRK